MLQLIGQRVQAAGQRLQQQLASAAAAAVLLLAAQGRTCVRGQGWMAAV
jgi:hypothetical protein